MRKFVFAVCVLFPSFAWAQNCPPGQFQSFDNFDNQICKRFNDGGTSSVQKGANGQCPNGMIPGFDQYGTPVCQKPDSSQKFYDTSKGCPPGTIPGFDMYGQPVCKRI